MSGVGHYNTEIMDSLMVKRLGAELSRATVSMAPNRQWDVVLTRMSGGNSTAYTVMGNFSKINIQIAMSAQDHPANSDSFILEVLSLYYHELAHVWFTPGLQVQNLGGLDKDFLHYWNMLEDKRIESFAVACYPNLAHFYRRGFAHMIMRRIDDMFNDDRDRVLATAWAIAVGRNYLDPALMDRLAKEFVVPDLMPQITDVVNEFRKLQSKNMTRRDLVPIVERFIKLMKQVNEAANDKFPKSDQRTDIDEFGPGATNHASQTASGGIPKKSEEEDALQLIEDDMDSFENTGGKPSEDSEDQESDGQADADDDASTDGGKDSDNANKLMNALQTILDDSKLNNKIRDDVAQYRQSMRGGQKGGKKTRQTYYKSQMLDATPAMYNAANDFSRSMLEVVSPDIDPGRDRRESVGRLNVGRYMRGESIDTVFDRWAPGHQDAFDLVCGIVIDSSPSMDAYINTGEFYDPYGGSTRINGASKAAWIIRRALEANRATVRNMHFNDNYDWMYTEDRIGHQYEHPATCGGTDPLIALEEMSLWMNDYERRVNRLLIIATDGQWSNQHYCSQRMAQLRMSGVYIAMIGIGADVDVSTHTEVDYHGVVKDVENGLTQIAKDIVVGMYKSINSRMVAMGRYQ